MYTICKSNKSSNYKIFNFEKIIVSLFSKYLRKIDFFEKKKNLFRSQKKVLKVNFRIFFHPICLNYHFKEELKPYVVQALGL